MKVMVNALSARRGGIITYTRNLIQSFSERGVDAVFALPVDSEIQGDMPTLQLSVTGMSPLRRAIWEQTRWRKIVKEHKPDILFSSANFGLLRPGVPQVLLVREGGLFDPVYLASIAPSLGVRPLFERILRRRLILASARSSDLVLTPTDAMRDLLQSWAPDLEGDVQTNLYGTRLNHFREGVVPRQWREDGVLRVLLVSAYYAHKQPGMVAEAVRLLNEAGIPAHFSLTMSFDQISDSPGGAKDEYLLKQAVARGEVTMLGHVNYNELPELYGHHDVFVSPSLSETFGHPMVEAMASGTILAVADTPVHREVCKDAAVYFHPTLVATMVDRLRELDADPGHRQELIARAGNYGDRDYSWESHVDRLLDCFERVYKSGGTGGDGN